MRRPVQFNDKPVTMRRIAAYVIGMFILSLGISLSVKSQMGVSPVTSVPYTVSRVLHMSVGMGTIIVYCLYIFAEFLIYRKQFRLTYLIQLPASFVFGWFIDLTGLILGPIDHHGIFAVQLVMIVISVMLVALGVRIYLTADIMAIPSDALTVAISWATKKPLHRCKLFFDCGSVAVALALSLSVFRDWEGIWIGTVLAALGVGQALRLYTVLFEERLKKFIFGTENFLPQVTE